MAKGYVILLMEVEDQGRYDRYSRRARALSMKHGARPLVVTDEVESLKGDWLG